MTDPLTSMCCFEGAIAMATTHQDFVVGVVCRSHLSSAPEIIHMTPGECS